MDEVDIDNVDELNELEARLYAQIHHEAAEQTNDIVPEKVPENNINDGVSNTNIDNKGGTEPNYETSSRTNRMLSRRYWANGEQTVKQQEITSSQYQHNINNPNYIRNPFKTPNKRQHEQYGRNNSQVSSNKSKNVLQNNHQPKTNDQQSTTAAAVRKTNQNVKSVLNINKNSAEKNAAPIKSTNAPALATESTSREASATFNDNKNYKSLKTEHYQSSKPKTSADNQSNLKLNPVAEWMKKNKNNKARNSTFQKRPGGPFANKEHKLQKVKRLEEKKQKSKKAKNRAASISNKKQPSEIIDLDSDNESDASDVILIPTDPAPTFTVEDSGDEVEVAEHEGNSVPMSSSSTNFIKPITLTRSESAEQRLENSLRFSSPVIVEHEENALDSTDVEMSSTTTSFVKPPTVTGSDNGDKRLENTSRCTSPCSIQSSDDFIGQNDRCRLLVGASGVADDDDLLVLTSDINSLLEVPETTKQIVEPDNCVEGNLSVSSTEQVKEDENMETNDLSEFATPKISKKPTCLKDYRVDQGQFRALDVYESESDITDSVYSKGANKTTLIRQIDTSSDEVEEISTCTQRTKRLRKRRASSSNKESDPNNENLLSSSDNADNSVEEAEHDDNKLLRTPVSFIARGPAVERCIPRKRSRTLSSCSPHIHKRKSSKTTNSSGHMSDTKFIATLNNLAQGQEQELATQEDVEESDTDNVPSARDIAEKVLATHNATKEISTQEPASTEMAITEEALNGLDEIFETIDNIYKHDALTTQASTPDDTVNVDDSSDSDREKYLKYKSLPNDIDAQVIEYSPDTSRAEKSIARTHDKNGSPIYHVVYSRGHRKPGGLGWNDEMRRFYNESWNGEHFRTNKILQKMNSDKTLWKICIEDRFSIKANKRHNNMKCMNCCEFGHVRSKCKRPRKPLICYMCGESGHQEPRCPNTICLRCGNKTQVFTRSCNACSYQNRLICPICKIRGHSLDYCPDKWRRYHSTTEPNSYPNSKIIYNPRKFCCICGGSGHLSDNCRSAVRFMEYPTIVSTIKSHQKSYEDVVVKTPHNGIALNLMYDPCQEYKFDLAAATSLNKYYGRFLKAVNLDFLLKRNVSRVPTEIVDSTVKKAKRLSKKYVANPYSKVGRANQSDMETTINAPNQVQEITESGKPDDQDGKQNLEEAAMDKVEDNSNDGAGSDSALVGSTVTDVNVSNIQLNIINEIPSTIDESFKSPNNLTSTVMATTSKSQTEPPLILDSDSNYSFSEHFDDVPSTSVEIVTTSEAENIVDKEDENKRSKPREMDALPDFIPLLNSVKDNYEENNDNEIPTLGISRKFVSAETEDEMEEERRDLTPLTELPCEAKIYLTHLHVKYLLSPAGNAFLVKTSRAHKLRARLDFTSVGHVLLIFGLPSNQDNFQRELLMKYRELGDERNYKQLSSNLNVPKRTDVLIRFLRENITQLMKNLGNVNHLLKCLHFLEKQQSKSASKLSEKVRRSLNMILVGQAGLLDGTMHLDKLLVSLKTLINDFKSEDVTPPQLRSEITNHWKVIFSSYRHENYQQLVNAYNKLIMKNRVPKLVIDPILLGKKILDTSLTEEQKQKLEQAVVPATETAKEIVPHSLSQKNTKLLKRKQNTNSSSSPKVSNNASTTSNSNKIKTTNSRAGSPAKPATSTDKNNSQTVKKSTNNNNKASTSVKKIMPPPPIANTKTTTPASKNNSQTQTVKTSTKSTSNNNTTTLTPPDKMMPPSPFANPEQRSSVSTTIREVSDKWKSTCDSLLTEISADKSADKSDGRSLDSKKPSTFWSRESMRYLDECVGLVAARPYVTEKLQRVQNKSKNGQLSYNDYLAVIKLHTALKGK